MRRVVKKCEIAARREQVFEALTEPLNISQWSGDEAIMNPVRGGSFSLWGGSISGENVEISQSKIVQKWKEKDWSDFSTVTIRLTEQNGKTFLELVQNDFPESSFASISDCWDKYYLGPLKKFLEH